METMPYHPGLADIATALDDVAAVGLGLPTWGLPTSDWTRELPVLGDGTFTLLELTPLAACVAGQGFLPLDITDE